PGDRPGPALPRWNRAGSRTCDGPPPSVLRTDRIVPSSLLRNGLLIQGAAGRERDLRSFDCTARQARRGRLYHPPMPPPATFPAGGGCGMGWVALRVPLRRGELTGSVAGRPGTDGLNCGFTAMLRRGGALLLPGGRRIAKKMFQPQNWWVSQQAKHRRVQMPATPGGSESFWARA